MEYKKDKVYRVAVVLAAISIVDMVITFLMMSYSSNLNLIVWCFGGGVLLVIANFIMVAVKRKYERVYEDEPPIGEIVKENAISFKDFLFKRGVAGFVAMLLLVTSFGFFAISGIRVLSTKYERSGAINAGYHFNLREAEKYDALSEEELEKGNEKLAEEFRLNAEKCRADSEWYFLRYLSLSCLLQERLNLFYFALGIFVVYTVGYFIVIIVTKPIRG